MTGMKEFGDKLLELCKEYNVTTMFGSYYLDHKEAMTLTKVEDDSFVVASLIALMFTAVPSALPMFLQVVGQVFIDTYITEREKAKKGEEETGDLLDDFVVKGKLKN